jgi:hypothetical protein
MSAEKPFYFFTEIIDFSEKGDKRSDWNGKTIYYCCWSRRQYWLC